MKASHGVNSLQVTGHPIALLTASEGVGFSALKKSEDVRLSAVILGATGT